MKNNPIIRMAYLDEWEDAMELAWKTFLKFESNDYSKRGIDSFKEFITDTTLHRMFTIGSYQMMVAVEGKKIIGIITLRDNSHISLLFVEDKYHLRGIGQSLVKNMCQYLKEELDWNEVTVNSSPYAVDFYHKLGFFDTGTIQENDGVIYTPMKLLF